MEKVQMIVLGLSASPASNNAFALILKEADGERRMPIIIGSFEAQAIAFEIEGVTPPRPMTHDLIKNVIDSIGATLSEVYIYDLVDGTYFAKLIFDTLATEVDSRPSDAIAVALRCQSPIYVSAEILDTTGLSPLVDDPEHFEGEEINMIKSEQSAKDKSSPKSRIEMLQLELDRAIKDEDYEKAAKLRDELKRILDTQ
jgi:bifunctional DNase/RNase